MNASSMNGAGTSGGGAGGGGLPMGVPVMGGGGNQPMGMVPNTQGIMAQGKPGAPNQNVLDAVKKVSSSIFTNSFWASRDPDLSVNKQKNEKTRDLNFNNLLSLNKCKCQQAKNGKSLDIDCFVT
jgi:hypothetical protein